MPVIGHAQAYPAKSIRLVVPFATGGLVDASARVMAESLSRRLGQQVYVENRPGAGGSTGTAHVAAAEGDGYTLLLSPESGFLLSPHIYKNLPYHPTNDFAPVGKFGVTTLLLVAKAESGIKTVADVIARAKTAKGLTYGSAGAGSNTHVMVEMLKQITDTNLIHVPYKGGAPAITDLLGGQIDLVSTTPATAAPFIKSGRLVGIAVATTQRTSALPDVPTFIESGANFSYNSWLGIFAPAKTPAAIVARLNSELNAVVGLPEVREKLLGMGATGTTSAPDAFAQEIKRDLERYGPMIKKANVTAA